MSVITLYGISNCDTIKKTRKWLEDHATQYQFHDYRKDGVSSDLVETFLGKFPAEQLINKRGTTWRGLSEKQQKTNSRSETVKLLVAHPALIKRPLLQRGKRWQLGYDETALLELIKS